MAAANRNPGRQISIVDEMMFRKPDKIETEPVEPGDLFHDGSIEVGGFHSGLGRVAEIVNRTQA
jgi:hypothetical protein